MEKEVTFISTAPEGCTTRLCAHTPLMDEASSGKASERSGAVWLQRDLLHGERDFNFLRLIILTIQKLF